MAAAAVAPQADTDAASRFMRDATALAEAGAFGRAAELFARAAANMGGFEATARPLEARAQCLMEVGDFAGAAEAATSAVRASPSWPAARATLGRALLNFGQLADAVDTLKQASDLAAEAPDGVAIAEELATELPEARGLLKRHWAEHHEVVVTAPGSQPGGPQVACVPCGAAVRIRQSLDCRYCNLNGELGPGGAVWAAGAAMAQLVLAGPPPGGGADSWKGLRVLELGSGTGVAGLAAAAAGAEVLLTDRETLMPLMTLNIGLNRGQAECAAFDWLAPPPECVCRPWDVVLAADLVYSFDAVAPFVAALSAVLRPGRAPRALYAHNARSEDLDAQLRKALEAEGLAVSVVQMPPAEPVGHIGAEKLRKVVLMDIRRP